MATIISCLFKFVEWLLFWVVCTWIMIADIYTDSFYVEYTLKKGNILQWLKKIFLVRLWPNTQHSGEKNQSNQQSVVKYMQYNIWLISTINWCPFGRKGISSLLEAIIKTQYTWGKRVAILILFVSYSTKSQKFEKLIKWLSYFQTSSTNFTKTCVMKKVIKKQNNFNFWCCFWLFREWLVWI